MMTLLFSSVSVTLVSFSLFFELSDASAAAASAVKKGGGLKYKEKEEGGETKMNEMTKCSRMTRKLIRRSSQKCPIKKAPISPFEIGNRF
jgi:hypothetical protein